MKKASGQFHLRLAPDIYAKAKAFAAKAGLSLNEWVRIAVNEKLGRK